MKQIHNDIFFSWVEREIMSGKKVQFLLKGVSMHPFIRDRKDSVLLAPCCNNDLKPMDIVLFKYKGKHLLHRIIKRESDKLTLKGDGSYVAKEVCTINDVIGKVEAIINPSGNYISVDNWKWKIKSFIWVKMGILRNPILRMIN